MHNATDVDVGTKVDEIVKHKVNEKFIYIHTHTFICNQILLYVHFFLK